MDSTTLAWVIVAVIVAVVILGLAMGRRLQRGGFKLGKIFRADVEGSRPGPTIRDSEAKGRQNKIVAEGEGALIERTRAEGEENVIGSKTR